MPRASQRIALTSLLLALAACGDQASDPGADAGLASGGGGDGGGGGGDGGGGGGGGGGDPDAAVDSCGGTCGADQACDEGRCLFQADREVDLDDDPSSLNPTCEEICADAGGSCDVAADAENLAGPDEFRDEWLLVIPGSTVVGTNHYCPSDAACGMDPDAPPGDDLVSGVLDACDGYSSSYRGDNYLFHIRCVCVAP